MSAITKAANWLRRHSRFLNRRWTHDPAERERHAGIVAERLRALPRAESRSTAPSNLDDPA